jgi:hypothetical protein
MVIQEHKIWKLAKKLTEELILDAFGKSHRRDPQMQYIYIYIYIFKTIKQNKMTKKKRDTFGEYNIKEVINFLL